MHGTPPRRESPSMAADRRLQRWSTDDVEPRHRLEYWIESICHFYLEMSSMAQRGDSFFGRIALCPLECITPTRATGAAQSIRRDRLDIERSDRNSYYLISQERSAWRILHAGQDRIVQPGESVLVDSRIPYEFQFPNGLDVLSTALPIDWVQRWLPAPSKALGIPLQGQSDWGLALRGMRQALDPAALPALPIQPRSLEDQLGILLGLTSAQWGEAPRRADTIVARCEAHMRERLSEPGLAAGDIAHSAGTSLRNLHRAFASQQRTFTSSLRAMRLEEAARMLADTRFRRITIGEIARRCGFADASHFTRQFHLVHGVNPKALRAP